MSGRAYLSIGDVLTLLREEFPDVTISKIRFLESQGLVNPERSPSGYRKFFEHDVERLRWVLRQQREHFLPLKVIRDRLAAGDLSDVGPEDAAEAVESVAGSVASTVRRSGRVPQPAHAAVGASVTGGVGSDPEVSSTHRVDARTEEQSAKADQEAMARILADASRRTARIPDNGNGSERTPLRVVPDLVDTTNGKTLEGNEPASAPARPPVRPVATSPAATAPPAPAAAAQRSPAKPAVVEPAIEKAVTVAEAPAQAPSAAGRAEASEAAVAAAVAESRAPSGSGAAKAAPVPSATPEAAKGPDAGTKNRTDKVASTSASALQGMVTGASLTSEELCAASGLSEAELAGLLGFGLIESIMVAGIVTFNEDALTVANLASEFRKFGIEPRHLRLYRNSVDREMGLIEQVIIPLLRQRNPESRQRAVDGAEELGALGQTMRAALLRSALRRHLGG